MERGLGLAAVDGTVSRMLAGWLETKFFGVSTQSWLIAAAIALGAILTLRVVKGILVRYFARIAKRTSLKADDVMLAVLEATRGFFYLAIGLWLAVEYVALSAEQTRWVRVATSLLGLVQIGLWLQAGVRKTTEVWSDKADGDGDTRTMASAISFIAKLVIWSVLLLTALSTLGFEISALLAGLGVGGIAAALAVQNLLGDVFASLSIYFDRPFELGDFIIVGSQLGTVERVGLRTTRVRSLGGEQIVFPNADLTSSRIHNYKRMEQRRIVFGFGVRYSTPAALLERIPQLIQRLIEEQPDVRFDRAHFKEYGQFALTFEVVYYVLSPDYNVYMDRQQAVNLGIFKAFEELGIEFALPTRTVHLQPADDLSGPPAGARRKAGGTVPRAE